MLPLTDLEVPPGFLDDYLIRVRQRTRPLSYGGHIWRRMGQSQEFREFKTFSLGDDLRHLDVRNSVLRQKQIRPLPWENLLLRRFEAEEQMQIVISVDTRETMLFPRTETGITPTSLHISKLQIARWFAEVLARIAAKTRDIVVLHRLFGEESQFIALPPVGAEGQIRTALDSIIGDTPSPDRLSLDGLAAYLPPAAVWIILSDFYFPGELPSQIGDSVERGAALYRHLLSAQDGMRWIILIDLDTWVAERDRLGKGARRLDGPFSPRKEMQITKEMLDETETRIQLHKKPFSNSHFYGAWEWWKKQELNSLEQARIFFNTKFEADERIADLFRRDV